MEKVLLPSLIIALSFAVMSLLASFGGHSAHKNEPSTRMTTGTRSHTLRRYYDTHHSTSH